MTKILFTHSYFYQFDPKQWSKKEFYPPLGTIFAASFLREKGYLVDLFDTNLIENPNLISDKIQEFNPKYLVIYDDGFNYLTKMCLTNMREAAFEMIKIAKSKNITTIINSSDSTDHYEKYLIEGVDFVVIGEGEQTLLELINSLESNSNIENIAGISFLQNNVAIKTKKREVLKNLDNLPQPAWDLVDMTKYAKIWKKNHGYFGINIATTRGCPYKCNWCAKPIYGNRYNSRSPENVVNEIELLIKQYKVDYFWVCDDIFGLKPGWVQKFSQLLKDKNLKIKFKIQSRVDLLLKEDTIDALVEAGLHEVWVGAESGSQKILDAMDKGTQVSQIYEATQLLQSKGVRVAFFIQFGYLGETKSDIRATFKMLEDLMPDDIGASVSYPLPGTGFYEKVKEELKLKANWTDSDDLALMFKNNFQPEFYKDLHNYLHKFYRGKQSVKSFRKIIQSPFNANFNTIKSAGKMFYYLPMTWHTKRKINL